MGEPSSRAKALISVSCLVSALAATGPCDIYALDTPCIAAHSTTRALYGGYAGALYRVRRAVDNATLDVGVADDGLADAAAQEAFCGARDCAVVQIFDQSPSGNHLFVGIAGSSGGGKPDAGVNASRQPLTLGGRAVYGAYFEGKMGYRTANATGVATGDAPESMYVVTAGRHWNDGCCFDYGNAAPDARDHGRGTMEALYFGNRTKPTWSRGAGTGPWVMADLESGLWAGNESVNPQNQPVDADVVTAMLKGRPGGFALKAGDAATGPLALLYDGPRPNQTGYDPMSKQGAIVLGTGGDNSNDGVGTFFEGAITAGYATDATDAAIQANIVAAGYEL